MLVVHFQAVAATRVFIDITSFLTIERDLINSLQLAPSVPVYEYSSVPAGWTDARDLDSHSTASRPVSAIRQAVRGRQ
jgi:hypothetical protein